MCGLRRVRRAVIREYDGYVYVCGVWIQCADTQALNALLPLEHNFEHSVLCLVVSGV